MSGADKTRAASRLRLVLRILAVLTSLETAAALWELGVTWSWAASSFAARGGMPPRLVEGFWLDAALGVALIASAVLLWRGKPAGLTALTFTIIAEGAAWSLFPVVFSALLLAPFPRPQPSPMSPSWASGNLFLGIQIITLFPLVAAFLIILAARYRAILASDAEGRAADGRPALTAWKAMVATRLLAAVTFLEAAQGLLNVSLPLRLLRTPLAHLPPLLAADMAALGSHRAHTGYLLLGIDITFSALLLGCAALLWVESRWGLIGIVAVLVLEVGGLAVGPLSRLSFGAYNLVVPGLGSQIGTGYPLVAAFLLILAYRWRRAARVKPA